MAHALWVFAGNGASEECCLLDVDVVVNSWAGGNEGDRTTPATEQNTQSWTRKSGCAWRREDHNGGGRGRESARRASLEVARAVVFAKPVSIATTDHHEIACFICISVALYYYLVLQKPKTTYHDAGHFDMQGP